MAGQISQAESQVIYRRLCQLAVQMLGAAEEAQRLFDLNASVDLSTNLDEEAGGHLTKAQVLTFVAEINKYRSYWSNTTVAFTGSDGGPQRRAAIDPFILAEPLIG